jgi:hypothetical protein
VWASYERTRATEALNAIERARLRQKNAASVAFLQSQAVTAAFVIIDE